MTEGRGSNTTASTRANQLTSAAESPPTGGFEHDVEELAAVLHVTPCQQWPWPQPGNDTASHAVFDEASKRVREAWSDYELRAQYRHALTAAATEVILSMPGRGGEPQVGEHLQKAVEALRAAQELSSHPAIGRAMTSTSRSSAPPPAPYGFL